MKVTVSGRVAGMPAAVHDVIFDNEEMQCPGCERRFASGTVLLAHVADHHAALIKGENPQ